MQRRRNHLIWLGPLIALIGGISYFTFFARFPVLRDFPWVNLPLVLLGVVASGWASGRAFGADRGLLGKILAPLGLLFSLAVGGLFTFYVFSLSYQLPEPTELSARLEQAPEFELTDQHGATVRLADLRGRRVVLTFYRGHW